MSSSMFGGGFKSAKCKTLLRLAMARIKLLRNKRDVQVKQMRKDIAQLLSTGQDPSARIRVEHIAREQNIMAAYDMIELFCELIIVRLPIIESHKVCPVDLKEAVSSLVFASPRCSDLPELLQIRSVFSGKYGKEFVAAALELRPECGVNRRIVEKLSVRAPTGETRVKLLTEIAAEYHVSWDPSATLAELLKQPEDLLDGPKKFFGASEMPIPEPLPSPPKRSASSHSQTPKAAVLPSRPAPSAARRPTTQLSSSDSEDDASSKKLFCRPMHQKAPPSPPPPPRNLESRSSTSLNSPNSTGEPNGRARKDRNNETHADYDNAAAAAKAAAQSADRAVAAARAAAQLAKTHPFKTEQHPPSRSASHGRHHSSSSDEEDKSKTNSSRRAGKLDPQQQQQPGKSASCYVTSDSYYRNGSSGFRS